MPSRQREVAFPLSRNPKFAVATAPVKQIPPQAVAHSRRVSRSRRSAAPAVVQDHDAIRARMAGHEFKLLGVSDIAKFELAGSLT